MQPCVKISCRRLSTLPPGLGGSVGLLTADVVGVACASGGAVGLTACVGLLGSVGCAGCVGCAVDGAQAKTATSVTLAANRRRSPAPSTLRLDPSERADNMRWVVVGSCTGVPSIPARSRAQRANAPTAGYPGAGRAT